MIKEKDIRKNKLKTKNPIHLISYIPMKIESNSPANELMARNILFGRYAIRNGKNVTAHALYNPEYSSLEIEKGDNVVCVSMSYYND